MMDEHGIEMMLLSLNAPAVQAIPDTARAGEDRAQGQRLSRRAGAQAAGPLSGAWRRSPCRIPKARRASWSAASRSSAFAARWSTAFRKSAMPTPRLYYDLPQYRPFWATAERLDVPFYLHPRNPLPRDARDL